MVLRGIVGHVALMPITGVTKLVMYHWGRSPQIIWSIGTLGFHIWSASDLPMIKFTVTELTVKITVHDDVIKWKQFPRYWPFVRGIHRSPVNSPHSGQWRGALMFSLICAWINGWVNSRQVGHLRRHRAHYDVTVMVVTHMIRWQKDVSKMLLKRCR